MEQDLKSSILKVAKHRRNSAIIKLAQSYMPDMQHLRDTALDYKSKGPSTDFIGLGRQLLFGKPPLDTNVYGDNYLPQMASRYSGTGGHPGLTPYGVPAYKQMRPQTSIWGSAVVPFLGRQMGLNVRGGLPKGVDWLTAERAKGHEADTEGLRAQLGMATKGLLEGAVGSRRYGISPNMLDPERSNAVGRIASGLNLGMPLAAMLGSQFAKATTAHNRFANLPMNRYNNNKETT